MLFVANTDEQSSATVDREDYLNGVIKLSYAIHDFTATLRLPYRCNDPSARDLRFELSQCFTYGGVESSLSYECSFHKQIVPSLDAQTTCCSEQ